MQDLAAGQQWTYRAPEGFAASRMVIGALLSFADGERVVCACVTGAPQRTPQGGIEIVTIPFLPMTEAAFRASAVALDGAADVAPGFAAALDDWSNDPRGLTTFTVPFEGFLDRMIALQMAAIVGHAA